MTLNLRTFSVSLVCLVLSLTTTAVIAQTPASQVLVLNQPQEYEIKGGESHSYAISLGANQTARVEIEHERADVALAAYKPNGERFIETDSPTGMVGNDLILVTAVEAGEYKIVVEPSNPKAGTGRYVIKLAEIRPTVAEDNQIKKRPGKSTSWPSKRKVCAVKGRAKSVGRQ